MLFSKKEEYSIEKAEEEVAKGQYDKAIKIYQALQKNQPENQDIKLYLANAYYLKKDWERAKNLFLEIIQRAPQHAVAHHFLAHVFDELQEYIFAVKHYNLAIDHTPNPEEKAVILYNLAITYKNEGNLLLALENFSQIISLEVKNVELNISALYNRAWCNYKLKNFIVALNDCESIFLLDEAYAPAHYLKGKILEALNSQMAKDAFEKAIAYGYGEKAKRALEKFNQP